MRGVWRLWFAAFAVCLAGVHSPRAHADVELRYKFKAGETLNYQFTQSMQMTMQVPGLPNDIVTRMKQQMFLDITTDEVLADGSARQRQIIRRITMQLESRGGPMPLDVAYDSDSPELPTGPVAESLMASLKPMVGAEWKQLVNVRGEVSNVEVPQKVVDALKATPGAAMMGNMATPEGLKQISTQSATVFPEKAVKLDDEWDSALDVKLPFGTMTTRKITRYRGPNTAGQEEIGLRTEITFVPAANAPAQLKIVDNEADGRILFDNRSGRILQNRLDQTTTMQVIAGGQQVDQVVTTDVLFELSDFAKERTATPGNQ